MKNIISIKSISIVAMLLVIICASLPMGSIANAAIADGEYTINYEILKGDPKDDSTSLANGYWNKPATVIVNNSVINVRTVINKDAWVVKFATTQGNRFVDTKVISRNTEKNSRVVEFKVASLEQDLVTTMTVDIPEQNYYHDYEARFRFDLDSLTLVSASESKKEASATKSDGSSTKDTATVQSTKPSESTTTAESSASTKSTITAQSSASTKSTITAESTTAPSLATQSGSPSKETTSDSNNIDEKQLVQANEKDKLTSSPASTVHNGASRDEASNANDEQILTANGADRSGDATASSGASIEQEVVEPQLTTNEDQVDVALELTTEENSDNNTGEAIQAKDEAMLQSTAIDQEEVKRGGTTTFIIILVIGLVFIGISIAWIMKQQKKK